MLLGFVKILNFPCFDQVYTYDCGAKSAQAVLAYYGHDVDEKKIIKIAGTSYGCGTSLQGLKRVLKKFGLKVAAKKMTIKELKKFLAAGIPVIILLQAWSGKKVDWKNCWHEGHFVTAMGYGRKKIYFEDPFCGPRSYLGEKELAERWHGRDENKKLFNYGLAVFGQRDTFDFKKAVHMN